MLSQISQKERDRQNYLSYVGQSDRTLVGYAFHVVYLGSTSGISYGPPNLQRVIKCRTRNNSKAQPGWPPNKKKQKPKPKIIININMLGTKCFCPICTKSASTHPVLFLS